jgi:F0F1-type ATP synthase assembly protein I
MAMDRKPTSATPGKMVGGRMDEQEARLGWRMAGLAFTMASEAGAGALFGWIVDYFAGTAPNGLLVGAVLGIAVGMFSLIRGAIAMNRLLSQQEAKRKLPKALPPEPDDDDDGTGSDSSEDES